MTGSSRGLAFALVLVVASLAGCVSQSAEEKDSDRDGLVDADEVGGWLILVRGPDGNESRTVKSSILRPDSDLDGLTDLEEKNLGSDPLEVDTDFDGLLDGKSIAADAELARGFRNWSIVEDAEKPGTFLGEASVCASGKSLNPAVWDSDSPFADGLGDGDELRGWNVTVRGESRHVRSDPCVPDSDGDGWSDAKEWNAGSDPTRKDTDGDGTPDSVDGDPLRDLGIRATVDSVTLAAAPPEGSRVRVEVFVAGRLESFEREAREGVVRVGGSVSENTEDAFDPTTGELPVQVFLRFSLVDAAGEATPLNLTGVESGGSFMELRVDAVRGTVRIGDGPTRPGSLDVTGPDGGARLAFVREEH